jgi:hypothetical protein
MTAKVFPIIPVSAKAIWVMLPVALILIVMAAKDYTLMLSAKHPEEMLKWLEELGETDTRARFTAEGQPRCPPRCSLKS